MTHIPRLLIVDDQIDNRLILEDLLSADYAVTAVADGQAALDSLRQETCDLILLDIVMPDIDGFEVCRRIKSNPATAEIPVLFLSGLSRAQDETQGLALGAVDFIHKPFSAPVVLARIRHHLQLAAARHELLQRNADLDQLVAARTRELQQSRDELSIAAAAFESQQCMLITDAATVIQRVNQAFMDNTGFAAADIVGKSTRTLKTGRHDRAFYTAMWDSITTRGFWQGEIWGKRKNGENFPKWLLISAVRNDEGAITHYVGSYIDLSEHKRYEAKIQHLAFYDQLTGLPNRMLLFDRLQQACAASLRTGRFGALLSLDLDNFKTLNDTQGHGVGDQLLQQVGNRLLELTRQSDTIARLGGDEFVIMLAGIDAESAEAAASYVSLVCRKLQTALNQPYHLVDDEYHCTASIGAALFQGQTTSDNILRQADLALHHAKRSGGNNFMLFDAAMESAVLSSAKLEIELRHAVQADEFELFYQPQVDGRDGRVLGAEALIRWRHPQRGMVPPNEFIPHAERTGLIVPIGQWVLETACRHLATWAKVPEMAHLVIAVNVSAQQFMQDDFFDQVLATLAGSDVSPDRLKLELTESMFAGNADAIVETMRKLKTMGIGFSLDDFGTGYSSLSYLTRLPLDQLKIDRSFVTKIESGDNNVVICAATIGLARSLKLKVVAEGVETEAQRYFLGTVHKCELHQGYLYSKPLPRAEFERYCLAGKA